MRLDRFLVARERRADGDYFTLVLLGPYVSDEVRVLADRETVQALAAALGDVLAGKRDTASGPPWPGR